MVNYLLPHRVQITITLLCAVSGKTYRKIPKISPWAYIFQRPFLRGYFWRVYLRREICVSNSIGLALYLEVNLPFLLCFTLYFRTIFQVQAPGGLIFGGAYFPNFTV